MVSTNILFLQKKINGSLIIGPDPSILSHRKNDLVLAGRDVMEWDFDETWMD